MQSIPALSASSKERVLGNHEPAAKIAPHSKEKKDRKEAFQNYYDTHFSMTAD